MSFSGELSPSDPEYERVRTCIRELAALLVVANTGAANAQQLFDAQQNVELVQEIYGLSPDTIQAMMEEQDASTIPQDVDATFLLRSGGVMFGGVEY